MIPVKFYLYLSFINALSLQTPQTPSRLVQALYYKALTELQRSAASNIFFPPPQWSRTSLFESLFSAVG